MSLKKLDYYINKFKLTDQFIILIVKKQYEIINSMIKIPNLYYKHSINFENLNIDCINCDRCIACYNSVNCDRCIACDNCYNCNSCYNCENCKMCYKCNKCKYCENCENCEKCEKCYKCASCDDCEGFKCFECYECKDCYNCENCENCENCYNCECCENSNECKNSYACNECNGCKDCVNCNDCEKCVNCESCDDCNNRINLSNYISYDVKQHNKNIEEDKFKKLTPCVHKHLNSFLINISCLYDKLCNENYDIKNDDYMITKYLFDFENFNKIDNLDKLSFITDWIDICDKNKDKNKSQYDGYIEKIKYNIYYLQINCNDFLKKNK